MHLGNLLARVRRVLQDESGTRWGTEELVDYLDEAHREFCSRLGLNQGSSALTPLDRTDEYGAVSYAFFSLPEGAIELVRLVSAGDVLPSVDMAHLPQGFETDVGTPARYIMGPYGWGTLRLWPAPVDPINLLAYYTKVPRSLGITQVPEIPEAYHVALTDFAIARAYSHDGTAENAGLAQVHHNRYEQKLLEASSVSARGFDRESSVVNCRWL